MCVKDCGHRITVKNIDTIIFCMFTWLAIDWLNPSHKYKIKARTFKYGLSRVKIWPFFIFEDLAFWNCLWPNLAFLIFWGLATLGHDLWLYIIPLKILAKVLTHICLPKAASQKTRPKLIKKRTLKANNYYYWTHIKYDHLFSFFSIHHAIHAKFFNRSMDLFRS